MSADVPFALQRPGTASSPDAYGLLLHPVTVALLPVLWLLLLVAFNMGPGVDVAVSALFFDATCSGVTVRPCAAFSFSNSRIAASVRDTLHVLPAVLSATILASLAVERMNGRAWRHPQPRLKATLLATLVLGPGLLVNGILKPVVGRPRPRMTELFGGEFPFLPAGEINFTAERGNSFVSGEAATAAWLVCLVLLLEPKHRPGALRLVVPIALFWMAHRVMSGSHYLSDVVLGALSTFVVLAAVAVMIEFLAARSANRPIRSSGGKTFEAALSPTATP